MKKILIIIGLPLLVYSCVEYPGACAADDYFYETRLWVINLDGTSLHAVQDDWEDTYNDLFSTVTIYGIDTASTSLYFTEDDIRTPEKINKLDYKTGNIEHFTFNDFGEEFTLSPDGTRFLFEERNNTTTVKTFTLTDSSESTVPQKESFNIISSPQWITKGKIAYNAFGEKEGIGIFSADLNNSTFTELSSKIGRWGYDISKDGTSVVFSGESKDEDGNNRSTIFYKHQSDQQLTFIDYGTYPKFTAQGNQIVYQSDGFRLADLDGNSEKLSSKKGSINTNIAVSPDGRSIAVAEYEGIFLIDIETKEIRQITTSANFLPAESSATSVNATFWNPTFSPNGQKIFFLVGRDYYDDGC